MVNEKIGNWLILSEEPKRKKLRYFKCQCICGRISIRRTEDIYKSSSCLNCYNLKKAKVHEMIGKKFGEWFVLKLDESKKRNKYYECQCKCGAIKSIKGSSLREENSKVCTKCRVTTHGLSRSKIYKVWLQMIQRCHNPNDSGYHNYGARGIKVCERWHDFMNFFNDVGHQPLPPRNEIDRIDNDGNYEPDNWRWATRKENRNNQIRNKIIAI